MRLNGHGADRGQPEPDPKPCAKTTWCKEPAGHPGPCIEIPRAPIERQNYGPSKK